MANLRIMVIDDNEAIHRDFIKILKPTLASTSELDKLNLKLFNKPIENVVLPAFEITTASQGQEGVALIQKALDAKHPYALAFVDIRMPPGWDGIETIKHIWELDKDIQVVICTAYSDYSWEETVANLGKTDNLLILKKPFDQIAVRQLACALTKKWELLQDTRQHSRMLKQQVEDRTISLQKSLSLVKATLESSSDGILVINTMGDVIEYNQKFINMWKVPVKLLERKDKLIEHMQEQLVNPEKFLEYMKSTPISDEAIDIDVMKFKDGKIFECFSQSQKLNDKTVGRVLNYHDVTKRAKLEEDLQYQATHDSLTGLPNRIMLLKEIREAIKQSEKNKSQFAVLFFDLDRFKLINDSLSHAVGDQLLQLTADRTQSLMVTGDMLARLGGDEFVVLIPNVTKEDQVIQKVEKLLNVFQKPFKISDREVHVTASIGISMYPKDGLTVDVLMRNADSAMYRAKELGANNFQRYTDEMNTISLAKLDQEIQLRQAMLNGELFVCYQPQYELSGDRMIAAEALIRWNHPEKGILLPIDFIPLAEETGLIVPIGEWILRTVCKQNKAWQDEGLPPIRIAVNVTGKQLKQHNIVETVRNILKETGLKPEYLELELTENVILSSIEVIDAVTELKKLGITIAVDDFGTGYSSLSHLKKIPLDRLKIDSSFIQHIQSENDDEVIIRSVIAIAKNLNLEVLAEGVETNNQLEFLKTHECGEIQGFYYSKPLAADEIKKLLRNPADAKIMSNMTSPSDTSDR